MPPTKGKNESVRKPIEINQIPYYCDCNLQAKSCRGTTKDNLGRLYVGCPKYPKKNACDFFQWIEPKRRKFFLLYSCL